MQRGATLARRGTTTIADQKIPKDPRLDSTLALLRRPYTFISDTCESLASDVFQCRFQLQTTICMRGAEAARLFSNPRLFERKKSAPLVLRNTLVGEGGIQATDGEVHRQRKELMMSFSTPGRIDALVALMTMEWQAATARWVDRKRIVLLDEMHRILCKAVCRWAGVPLPEEDVDRRTADMVAMIEGAGGSPYRYWRGRAARIRTEAWLMVLIDDIRRGFQPAYPHSVAETMAFHHVPDGEHMPLRAAAVDLVNMLRPTVAVARYIMYIAHALHVHPECRRHLVSKDSEYLTMFVQEVRRFYPFFPSAVARVRDDFKWRGMRFDKGRCVLLDLYGTNHDPRLWDEPDTFEPERFRYRKSNEFDLIPQGAGDHLKNHRCAGEFITIELMKKATMLLIESTQYEVPSQDLRIEMRRAPATVRSSFVIRPG